MPRLDSLDERILSSLQENGRLTMKALAEQIGMSSPAVIERVRRLEERGMLTGYRGLVDPAAIGRPMSVLVQELVYRTFFFHRYGVLFGSWWWTAILVNGVLFGLGHIVIGTPLAIYGTMATGALFAWRYAMTRSFWAVFIEHTLWGALVFTVGLGRYFFTGVGVLNWR